jgi:hypothetical protein
MLSSGQIDRKKLMLHVLHMRGPLHCVSSREDAPFAPQGRLCSV